jgi:hypothetical protein
MLDQESAMNENENNENDFPTPDPYWIPREPVRVTVVHSEPHMFLVERITRTDVPGQDAMVLSFDEYQHLHFNGRCIDVGDDFFLFLGIFDEPETILLGYTWNSAPYCDIEDEDAT